jgi:hypothetical protein
MYVSAEAHESHVVLADGAVGIQRIRLAGQTERWERMAQYYRARGQRGMARRAERMLAAARQAAADEAMIALVAAPVAEPVAERTAADWVEYDRAVYEYQTSAAWGV